MIILVENVDLKLKMIFLVIDFWKKKKKYLIKN